MQRRGGFSVKELQSITEGLKELCRDERMVRLKKNHYGLPDGQNLLGVRFGR